MDLPVEAIRASVNHVIHSSVPPFLGQRLRLYFDHEVTLLASSPHSHVFTVKYGSLLPMIMKTPRGEEGARALRHEALIGHHLNELRSLVPTFMYTYGLTTGADPLIFDHHPITFLLNGDNSPSPKLFTELITSQGAPAMTFEDYLRRGLCDNREYATFILGICYALELAQRRFKFVHYDLHPGNIMIRILSTPFTYQVRGREITTFKLPVIIDYGLSSLEEDDHYGATEDIFRLLYRTLRIAVSGPLNTMIAAIVEKLELRFPHRRGGISEFHTVIAILEREWSSDWIPSSSASLPRPLRSLVRSPSHPSPPRPSSSLVRCAPSSISFPRPEELAHPDPTVIPAVTSLIDILASLSDQLSSSPSLRRSYIQLFMEGYYRLNRELTTMMIRNDRETYRQLSHLKSSLRHQGLGTLRWIISSDLPSEEGDDLTALPAIESLLEG